MINQPKSHKTIQLSLPISHVRPSSLLLQLSFFSLTQINQIKKRPRWCHESEICAQRLELKRVELFFMGGIADVCKIIINKKWDVITASDAVWSLSVIKNLCMEWEWDFLVIFCYFLLNFKLLNEIPLLKLVKRQL